MQVELLQWMPQADSQGLDPGFLAGPGTIEKIDGALLVPPTQDLQLPRREHPLGDRGKVAVMLDTFDIHTHCADVRQGDEYPFPRMGKIELKPTTLLRIQRKLSVRALNPTQRVRWEIQPYTNQAAQGRAPRDETRHIGRLVIGRRPSLLGCIQQGSRVLKYLTLPQGQGMNHKTGQRMKFPGHTGVHGDAGNPRRSASCAESRATFGAFTICA